MRIVQNKQTDELNSDNFNNNKMETYSKIYSTSFFLISLVGFLLFTLRTIKQTLLNYNHLCQGNDFNALITHTFARVSSIILLYFVEFFFWSNVTRVDDNRIYMLVCVYDWRNVMQKYCNQQQNKQMLSNWNIFSMSPENSLRINYQKSC